MSRVTLLLNSLGDDVCRPPYLDALREFLAVQELCDEHTDTYERNPLRVLDCKRDVCRAATEEAPRLIDNLCAPCAAHFARVRAGLESLGIAYVIQPRLVRGLDYYTRTTFELAAESLESAQNAVGGGGRYDKLAEALGGPPTPGIGFGLGIERLMLACDAESVLQGPGSAVDVWVVDTTGGSAALALTHELRGAGIAADRSYDGRSMKSQFKAADRSGARLALVIGEREASSATVTLRDLRSGDEETVGVTDVVAYVRKHLS